MIAILIAVLAASADDVSRAEMTETIEHLARLDRISGSEGEREANAYLKRKLTEYGVPFDAYEELVVESLSSQGAVALTNRLLLQRQQELLKFERDVLG